MFPSGDDSLPRIGRVQRMRLSLLPWERAQYLAVSAAIAGTLVLLGACLYRRFWHPEWTGGQAMETLWPFYLAAGLSIYVSWHFSDAVRK